MSINQLRPPEKGKLLGVVHSELSSSENITVPSPERLGVSGQPVIRVFVKQFLRALHQSSYHWPFVQGIH